MTPVRLRRLLPDPAVLTPAEALDGVTLATSRPAGDRYALR